MHWVLSVWEKGPLVCFTVVPSPRGYVSDTHILPKRNIFLCVWRTLGDATLVAVENEPRSKEQLARFLLLNDKP